MIHLAYIRRAYPKFSECIEHVVGLVDIYLDSLTSDEKVSKPIEHFSCLIDMSSDLATEIK